MKIHFSLANLLLVVTNNEFVATRERGTNLENPSINKDIEMDAVAMMRRTVNMTKSIVLEYSFTCRTVS